MHVILINIHISFKNLIWMLFLFLIIKVKRSVRPCVLRVEPFSCQVIIYLAHSENLHFPYVKSVNIFNCLKLYYQYGPNVCELIDVKGAV